ncbi:AraC family transcriptional regulator [Spirosoma taeanense]|uniref:AraC family transcriptional regulator n=1 Tax=Spirosoma taeanense TaxID=2735870 RepID=A0A6M5Y5E7_9BACT|nr:helix-turn-helix domain-containing protein [Spirosoma taeanense]QJW89708.1 AraC family transcriptional regulator [Spirosoma taeanense]
MLTVQKAAPSAPLQAYVMEYILIDVSMLPNGNGSTWTRLLPAPVEQTLIYYLSGEVKTTYHDGQTIEVPPGNLVGQPVHRILLTNSASLTMFMVRFRPSGFFRLFGVPMPLFTDSHEDVTLVLDSPVRSLHEQLVNAPTFGEMVLRTEQFLSRPAVSPRHSTRPVDWAIGRMFDPDAGEERLDKLADYACLSSRQFERSFVERVGVPPKLYARLIRFNRALRYRQAHPEESWLQVAYATGYFDHAHLIRDFKHFADVSPTDSQMQQHLALLNT